MRKCFFEFCAERNPPAQDPRLDRTQGRHDRLTEFPEKTSNFGTASALHRDTSTFDACWLLMTRYRQLRLTPAKDTDYMVEKTYHLAPYLGAFGAYLMPQ